MGADSMRRTGAILLVILGGAALWCAGNGAPASASANDAMVATIAAARERAAANDPRLKGASRFEEGGWIYVHLEGDPGADTARNCCAFRSNTFQWRACGIWGARGHRIAHIWLRTSIWPA